MTDKLMYIPNDDNENPFCRLQLVVQAQINLKNYQSSIKVLKVVKPTNKKNIIIKLWGLV